MRNALVAILCIAALLAAAGAQAVPSFRGYTGLVLIPTADSMTQGEYNTGVMAEDFGHFHANDIFANYSPVNNLEVGFDSTLQKGAKDRQTLLNAKYQIMPETESRAAIAFGVNDATNEIQSTAYAVASKSIGQGLKIFDNEITNVRAHIGVGGGGLNGVFGGLSVFLGSRIMLSAEWDTHSPNIGLRLTPVRDVRIHIGWFDVGGADTFGAGLSFNKNY